MLEYNHKSKLGATHGKIARRTNFINFIKVSIYGKTYIRRKF